MIETCLAVALISFILLGIIQISQAFAAREVLFHAAARGARARTVGFNDWMVTKAVQVAAIPNSGRMSTPQFQNIDDTLRQHVAEDTPGELWDNVLHNLEPASSQLAIEQARIPDYMYSINPARASYILDYEGWDSLGRSISIDGNMVRARTHQDYTLWVPMHRLFYADDSVHLRAEVTIENHYPFYLLDYGL